MLEWKENAYGERYLPAYNCGFERMPSAALFKQYVHEHIKEPHTLYIIVGSDSGLLPLYVEQNFADSGSRFIFIESEEVAEYLQQTYPSLQLPERKPDSEAFDLEEERPELTDSLVYVVSDPFDLNQIANHKVFDEYMLRQKMQVVKSLSVVEKPETSIGKSITFYENQFGGFRIHHNVGAQRYFMEAGLHTVADMIYPLKRMKDHYKDRTFVLLGGAPSLPTIFPWLRENRDKVVVIAANRIAGRLAQEGISPDYFVAVDPQPQVLDYSQKLFDFHDRSVLITSNHLAPNVMSQWAGRHFYMHTRFMFSHIPPSERGNVLSSGPTVMNSSVMVAGYLGAKTIILSGVDLCFDPSGNSHESASLESKVGRYLRYGGTRVMTYAGIEAETDIQMLSAGESLRAQVNWLKSIRPELSVININPYATKIDIIDQLSVDELPRIKHPVTVRERTTAWRKASIDAESYRRLLKQDVQKVLTKQISNLTKAIRWSDLALKSLAKVKDEHSPKFNHVLDLVIQRRKLIEKNLGEDLFVLFNYSFVDYVKLLEPLQGEQTIVEALDTLRSYFATVSRTASSFLTVLTQVQQRTEWRIKECDAKLTQELFDFWMKENTPGRCHVWFERHGCPKLSEEEQQLFDQASSAFNILVTEKAPSFRSQLESPDRQLISLWSHVKSAIKVKDAERIQDLAEYIATIPGEAFEQLSYFLKAHLAALSQNWSECESLLAKINHERLVIPALQLKLDNAFKQQDVYALLEAIEDLAQYDDYYYFMLATLANMSGLDELAGKAFVHYLAKRPKDVVAVWDYWRWLAPKRDVDAMKDLIAFMDHHNIIDDALLDQINAAISI